MRIILVILKSEVFLIFKYTMSCRHQMQIGLNFTIPSNDLKLLNEISRSL